MFFGSKLGAKMKSRAMYAENKANVCGSPTAQFLTVIYVCAYIWPIC